MMLSRLIILLALCGVLAACGANNAAAPAAPTIAPSAPTTAPPAPTAAPATNADVAPTAARSVPTAAPPAPTVADAAPVDLNTLTVNLELVADGFELPLQATSAGDGSNRLFVVEQRGTIDILRDGQILDQPFLDITSIVGSSANEQGLLSVAFHPDYASNGQFFINYTNLDGNTTIARYRVSDDADVADPTSAEILLTIEQPAANHNGGLVKFGPDGYLYIGMGDGGRAGDPWGNGQDRGALLGKLLRIDVDNGAPYAIPSDNPFANEGDARPEVWAWGLRNPWRFSFDRATGDLYIADVGQNEYEEVHYQPAASSGGENYGWNVMEGDVCFQSRSCDESGLEQPVAVYSHRDGCSITGGYPYRGAAFPQFAGVYFYSDFCSGKIWALHNTNGTWQNVELLTTRLSISSFGEDEAGELYLTDSRSGELYRLVATGG